MKYFGSPHIGWCRQREKIDWQEALKFDCRLVRTIFIFCCSSQFSQDIGEWPENQILIPDWTYFLVHTAPLETGVIKVRGNNWGAKNKTGRMAQQAEEDPRYYQVAAVFKQFGTPNPQFPKDLDLGTATLFVCLPSLRACRVCLLFYRVH